MGDLHAGGPCGQEAQAEQHEPLSNHLLVVQAQLAEPWTAHDGCERQEEHRDPPILCLDAVGDGTLHGLVPHGARQAVIGLVLGLQPHLTHP